jgi:hypothetical protein
LLVEGVWGRRVAHHGIWINNVTGPPPPNPSTAPVASLVVFSLIVGWGYMIDNPTQRARSATSAGSLQLVLDLSILF